MTQALVPIDQARTLVQEALKRGFLPQLGNETEKAIALVQEGFDPRFHLAIYQRRLIITADGMNWWLRRKDHYPSALLLYDDPILGSSERGKSYGLEEDEIGVIAKVAVPGVGIIAQGFGKASRRPYTYEAPPDNAPQEVKDAAKRHPDRMRNPLDATHTYRMAEKRADGQAIRKAAPMRVYVPTREEVGVSQATEPANDNDVIEGEARVLKDVLPRQEPRQQPGSPNGTMPLGVVAQYEEQIRQAAARQTLQTISYNITADAGLSPEEKASLRRLIGERSQELRG